MKRVLVRFLAVLLGVASVLLIGYPFVSNYLMSLNHESQVVACEENVKQVTEEEKKHEYEKARQYNRKFLSNVVITDPFDPAYQLPEVVEYETTLNFGDGLMGSVEIPAINVNLPIYHGTSEEVLQKGIGHMQNTSLPVGGKSTHCVLTGHTGLPTAKLFTDLDQLEKGDIFYTRILGDVRAYKITKIYVIEPDDTESLIVYQGKDLVSLITCTPYGINSHRLIVRGKRVPYDEAEHNNQTEINRDKESTWMQEYKRALIAGAVILLTILFIFIIIRFIIVKRRKKKEKKDSTKSEDKDNTGQVIE